MIRLPKIEECEVSNSQFGEITLTFNHFSGSAYTKEKAYNDLISEMQTNYVFLTDYPRMEGCDFTSDDNIIKCSYGIWEGMGLINEDAYAQLLKAMVSFTEGILRKE